MVVVVEMFDCRNIQYYLLQRLAVSRLAATDIAAVSNIPFLQI